MNPKVQSNYCSNNTKLNFTIKACFIQKAATSTTRDFIQLKTHFF